MMLAEAHNAQVPGELFEQAASWLEAAPMAPREAAAAPAPRAPRAAVTIAAGGDRVREQALSFGDRGRLFGILTEPLAPSAGRPTVVLLNNGAVTRVGSNRLYVTLARRWAALGFPVLRMDLGGIGDSRPAPGLAENVLYDPSGVADVLSALAHLQKTRAHERFVLAGLCAGGYFAFHTALLGPPVAGVIMINPLTFYWKPGDTIDEAPSEVYSTLREYKRSLFRQERWGKLLRGQVPVAYVLQLLLNWTATLVKTRLGQLRRRLARVGPGRGDVAADFRSLVDRGVDLLIVFSAGDASIDLVELHAGRELKRLARKGGLQTAVLEGADHTFTPVAAQRRLSDRLTEHLEQRFGRQARVEGSESASSRMR
jgi:alpha/beta superfamily hydrolase